MRRDSMMRMLVVGAGAAGGYLGAQRAKAGRDVRFLVHQRTFERLDSQGLRMRSKDGISALPVRAVTAAELAGSYDVIVLAVRSDVVDSAVEDIRTVVAPHTRIVPLVNGVAHLPLLTAAFGEQVVLGAAIRLATSMLADGTIDIVAPGIDLELGQLDGGTSALFDAVVREFSVDDVAVHARADMVAGMWEKFAFIAATAALTCLTGNVIESSLERRADRIWDAASPMRCPRSPPPNATPSPSLRAPGWAPRAPTPTPN